MVFSLLQEYNKKRLDLEGKISSYKESLIEIKNTLESLDNEKAVIQNNRFELSQKTGRLDESLKSFLNYEKALFDELDIPLIRSITLEYDEEDIKFVQDSFKLKRNSLFEMQKTCEKEIECLGVNKEQLKKEEASKHEHSSDLKINIVKSEDDIKQYKISEEKALSAIRNLELSSADLFNMSLNIINLDIKEKNLISKLDGYKLKLNSQKEYLESIKNGSAHISPEFSDKLRKLNIDFEIGEKFLLEEDNEDHRRQLLSNNPMLPFCYIVKRKDYEIIKNTDFEGSINKVIPIITFEDADINASLSKKAVEINDNKMLVCLYNKECIDEQSKKIFIENLENDIGKLQSSAETIQKDLEQFRVNKNDIISFNYERDYFTRKNDELKKFNDSFNITQNRLQVIAEEIKQNDERTALLTQNLNELKLSSVKNNENETRFNKYLDENAVYLSNYNDFQSVKTQISIYEKRYLEIDALIKEFMGNEKDFSDKERKTSSDLEKIKEKASSLDSSIIGEALNLPIEQMEIEYQNILSGIKHSIDEIERAIKSANDQISDHNKKLMRYSDYKDEYTNPNIVFSYEILKNAEYNEKNKQVIFETASENIELKANQVYIDLSPWMSNGDTKNNLEIIKTALEESRLISFEYANHSGNKTARTVEPYQLVLKSGHWYIQGYCLMRNDFRLFKLSRISSLQICEETFMQREYQKPLLDVTDIASATQIEIKFRIHKSIMDRVLDFCSFENFSPDGNEFYIVDFPFIENDYNFDFLLSLGDKCECLSPQHIREEMKCRIRSISKLYES